MAGTDLRFVKKMHTYFALVIVVIMYLNMLCHVKYTLQCLELVYGKGTLIRSAVSCQLAALSDQRLR